jgi:methylenetetrahydrofolate--tRNA-(uracil-5-)-methyltransferase
MNETTLIQVVGGGLAGSEAALQLARRGHRVRLFEMRPKVPTPAHQTEGFAELVCSNSFKGTGMSSAHGLFKKELLEMGSQLIPLAQKAAVDAGESLTVDRVLFSELVAQAIAAEPLIEVVRDEVQALDPMAWTILAAGPLCSDALARWLFDFIGDRKLHFFDAIAPVVHADSIDMEQAYVKNRWDKGETKDFINCPMDKETYDAFVQALVEADQVEPKPFEKKELFEGCLPIEEMARRGPETLRHGPMRPIGLMHPETGKIPWAVIQLRAENRDKTLYNLVGFQTRLKWGTQKAILTQIPALKNAEFARLGCMHRNTFLNAPKVLNRHLCLRGTRIFCAGQIIGAEGYTEAVGTGLFAAVQLDSYLRSGHGLDFPRETCLGALTDFLTSPNEDYQPMNFNFGLLPPLDGVKKNQRKEKQVERTLEIGANFALQVRVQAD